MTDDSRGDITPQQIREGLDEALKLLGLFGKAVLAIATELAPIAEELDGSITEIKRVNHIRKILDETGWLHHYTTPDEVVQTHGHNPEELRHEMLIHYRDNWTDIRAEIESRLLDYDIDPESQSDLPGGTQCSRSWTVSVRAPCAVRRDRTGITHRDARKCV